MARFRKRRLVPNGSISETTSFDFFFPFLSCFLSFPSTPNPNKQREREKWRRKRRRRKRKRGRRRDRMESVSLQLRCAFFSSFSNLQFITLKTPFSLQTILTPIILISEIRNSRSVKLESPWTEREA